MLLTRFFFLHSGMNLMRVKYKRSNEKRNARWFVALFGTSPDVCLIIWNMLLDNWTQYCNNPNPIHLLWSFRFMKAYNNWDSHAVEVGVDSKTFRKWVWFYIKGVSKLMQKMVSRHFSIIYSNHLLLTMLQHLLHSRYALKIER